MSDTQIIRKYDPPIMQREQNLFLEEYYCGTDTRILIDGKEQTEVSYISYNVGEQLKPLYGYTSRTWDDVAIGTRIVTGVLKVPINNKIENTPEEEYMAVKPESTIDKIKKKNEKDKKDKEKLEWTDDFNTDSAATTGGQTDPIQDPIIINRYQKKLKKLGYDLDVTGKNDKATYKALMKYQKDKGYPMSNGFFDERTRRDLSIDASNKQVRIRVNTYGYSEPKISSDNQRCYIPAGAICNFIEEYNDFYYVRYIDKDNKVFDVYISNQHGLIENTG